MIFNLLTGKAWYTGMLENSQNQAICFDFFIEQIEFMSRSNLQLSIRNGKFSTILVDHKSTPV